MKKSKPKDKKLAQKRERKAKRRKTRLSNGEHNYQVKPVKELGIIKTGNQLYGKKISLWQRIKNWFTKK